MSLTSLCILKRCSACRPSCLTRHSCLVFLRIKNLTHAHLVGKRRSFCFMLRLSSYNGCSAFVRLFGQFFHMHARKRTTAVAFIANDPPTCDCVSKQGNGSPCNDKRSAVMFSLYDQSAAL